MPVTTRSTSVMNAERRREGRQPRRFEKKKNKRFD